MAIFTTRAAAEEYVREDPFILEGVVKSVRVRDSTDSLCDSGQAGNAPALCQKGMPAVRLQLRLIFDEGE